MDVRFNSEKEQLMAEAILEHFIETGEGSTREDIAEKCGKTTSTVSKWLRDARGIPAGCRLEERSRRGGGGGPGKEYFYPRIHVLRTVILEERTGRE